MKDNDVKLIGICGPARAGKDTLATNIARIIIDTHNELFQDHVIATESFAAPIKSMIAMLLDFYGFGSVMNPSQLAPYLEGDLKEKTLDTIGVSPRVLMQTLGTEWGRKIINESIWLNSMEQRIKQYGEATKHGHKGAFVIITDVRFDNEAEMIKRNGGIIIHVSSTRDLGDVETHDTEVGVSDKLIDARIENNKELEDFEYLTLTFLEGLLEEKLTEGAPQLIQIPTDEGGVDEEDRLDSST